MPPLTARERSFLKARAHPLEPIVYVGHEGLTDAVLKEIERALTAHELIKVRVNEGTGRRAARCSTRSASAPGRTRCSRSARCSCSGGRGRSTLTKNLPERGPPPGRATADAPWCGWPRAPLS